MEELLEPLRCLTQTKTLDVIEPGIYALERSNEGNLPDGVSSMYGILVVLGSGSYWRAQIAITTRASYSRVIENGNFKTAWQRLDNI